MLRLVSDELPLNSPVELLTDVRAVAETALWTRPSPAALGQRGNPRHSATHRPRTMLRLPRSQATCKGFAQADLWPVAVGAPSCPPMLWPATPACSPRLRHQQRR